MRHRFLLLAAALAAFGASLDSGFHFDDYAIFSDPVLTSPGGWLRMWTLRQTRPLTFLTYWLNYRIGGSDPLGYHLLNLALHLGAVWLAYECLRRLMPARAAWFAAAIFALHPLQCESVDYIWGRSMVLASVLCLGSLLAWIGGRRWTALACFALALLAKEECAAFPLLLALLTWFPGQANPLPRPHGKAARGARWTLACMFLLSLAAGLRVVWAAAVTPGAQAGARAGIAPARYALAQGPAILRYLRFLLIPVGLTVDPDLRVPVWWLGALAWAAILALAVFAWRRGGAWGVWLVGGLVLLLPSSSIFPAADLAADRRMYLPLVAFAASAALLLERLPPRLLVCGVLLVASFLRTQVWASDEALWRDAVAQAPLKVRPLIQLSRAVAPPEILQLLRRARSLAPLDAAVATETGKVLLSQGDAAAALSEFGRALALDPRDADNYNNRGVALAALGQIEAAKQDFERALLLSPGLTSAAENLRKMQAR